MSINPDFYDIFLVLDTHDIDLKEVVKLVKMKEIRQPITKANIEKNWQIVLTQKEKEMSQIYYSRGVLDSRIEKLICNLPLIEIRKS